MAIKATEIALKQAKSERGMLECNAFRKRKAEEEANAHACDSLKSAHQAKFKVGARSAGLYTNFAMAREWASSSLVYGDDATTEEEGSEGAGV